MEFQIATADQLQQICRITDQAKRQLRDLGLDQWQKGYPSKQVWEQDIRERGAYVAVEDGTVLGAFAFQTTPDPSYGAIDGRWLTDGRYASMHRVCVADGSKGRGIAGKMFAFGFEHARNQGFPSMRIDTHPGNMPMQHALHKAGFQECGRIVLVGGCEAGNARIAFEKVL